MSKYIIEIPDGVPYVLLRREDFGITKVVPVAELEELNSDYINENFGSLQDEAYKQGYADAERIWRAPSSDNEFYQKGLEDAWEAARKIILNCEDGGVSGVVLKEVFDTRNTYKVINDNTASEAIAKLKAYEDKQTDRIEVGDEVVWSNGTTIVVTMTYVDGGFEWCDGVSKGGRANHVLLENVRKTGRHYDIQSILREMQND